MGAASGRDRAARVCEAQHPEDTALGRAAEDSGLSVYTPARSRLRISGATRRR